MVKAAPKVNETRRAAALFGVVLLLPACEPAAKVAATATSAVVAGGGAIGGAASTAVSGVGAVAGVAVATATAVRETGSDVAETQTTALDDAAGPSELARAEALGARVGQQITDSTLFCALIQAEYRIDCLADQLEQISGTIPDDPEFEPARAIISDTATKLNEVSRSRSSRSLRPLLLTSQGVAPSSSRPVIGIETDDLPTAIGESALILQEAEVLLLRSGAASEQRKVAYEEIAFAIGSTKILLRTS